MALSSSRSHHLLCPLLWGFHASARTLAWVEPHEFSKPSRYLGSWELVAEPREAWARLDRLRKGYARDVQLRRQYAYEVQLMEAERQRKAEAARIANQERRAAKLAAAQTRAAERRAFEEDFCQTLVGFDPSWRGRRRQRRWRGANRRGGAGGLAHALSPPECA
ncbi:hypothetical protein BDA96_06G197300 [Sorghum bicolor]|uniref:Cathepsin propeptide inhibitor domain-containing protein n=1 Tax=Sorghum bicolor TaxID=4558 RepID=A0A921QSN4_SORBI|nr:uncharacterized protein LOC8057589 [Sorghum bicolor]KAG0527029.1 hypothetical protein BDA96_06G197300 [Sorghum bicolor]|eukprot:XP_002446941.1 uncharacterized protein LOC8057589 [Sorghum bicolor]